MHGLLLVKMSLANTALSFLRLPGEIRNKIYRELYEPPCPDDTPGLEYINPEWWIPSCEDLLALMRTCRRESPFPCLH